jgi:PTH1 family peptidyl-tRNA hydrolase
MANQCLIAGLGNPGSDYARTRHNAGFALMDLLAERWDARWTLERKFNARLARAEWTGRSCLLCQPQTYMNESGRSVGALVDYLRLGLDQVLVAVDDADLPLGAIRMRPGGSSGGHHGLDSIARREIMPVEDHLPAGWCIESGEETEQGRLAAA